MKKKVTLLLCCLISLSLPIWGQTDDFFNPETVQDIQLKFTAKDWKRQLDSLRYNGEGLLEADLTINGQLVGPVGVRYRDGHLFQPQNPRNSLHLHLDFRDKSRQYRGYSTLRLSMALRDPSMVREVLATEIARKYFPAPQANYAKVSINGTFHGLFVNMETFEGPFLNRYFTTNTGTFFQAYPYRTDSMGRGGCLRGAYASLQLERNENCYADNFINLRGSGFAEITDLAKTLSQEPQSVEAILDVDRTLWMLAFNNLLVNLNSYSGSKAQGYYLYRDANGQFTPIIGDFNLTFGSLKNVGKGSDLPLTDLVQLDPLLHADNPYRPLISKLLANEKYRRIYLSHLRILLYNEFLSGAYENRARELQELVRPILASDPKRPYAAVDFERSMVSTVGELSQIPGIAAFMNERARFLRRHPQLVTIPPVLTDLKVKHREKFSANPIEQFALQVKASDYTKKVSVFYRFTPTENFKEMVLLDDGQHQDEQQGDLIFGGLIKPSPGQSHLEYYLVAENAKLVTFSPENYMFQRHHVTLEELNR